MRYAKIPLGEQMRKAEGGFLIHPEYVFCVLRAMGEMPLAAYFDRSTAKGEVLYKELLGLLGFPPEKEEGPAYREAAARIREWRQDEAYSDSVETAVRLLAEPLADHYRAWEEAKKHAENPA